MGGESRIFERVAAVRVGRLAEMESSSSNKLSSSGTGPESPEIGRSPSALNRLWQRAASVWPVKKAIDTGQSVREAFMGCELAQGMLEDLETGKRALARHVLPGVTNAGVEYGAAVVALGAAGNLCHAVFTPLRAVMGLSGAVAGLVQVGGCVDPTKRINIFGTNVSVSLTQFADMNLALNVAGLVLATRLRRSSFAVGSKIRSIWYKPSYYSHDYRRRLAVFENGEAERWRRMQGKPPIAWKAHLGGIGAGYLYYEYYLRRNMGLYGGGNSNSMSTPHSWSWIKADWKRTWREFRGEKSFSNRQDFGRNFGLINNHSYRLS